LEEYIFRGQMVEGRIIFRRGQIFPNSAYRVKNSFSLEVSWWMCLSESIWWNTYLEDRGWGGEDYFQKGQIFPCCGFRVKNSFSLGVSWWMCLSESIWWNTYLEDRGWGGGGFWQRSNPLSGTSRSILLKHICIM
jgi:hypothetical protein